MCDRELKEVMNATGPARSYARLAPAWGDRLPDGRTPGVPRRSRLWRVMKATGTAPSLTTGYRFNVHADRW